MKCQNKPKESDKMARKTISKKTITFYEGDESLLEKVTKAAEKEKRSFTSFVLKTLSDVLEKEEESTETNHEEQAFG